MVESIIDVALNYPIKFIIAQASNFMPNISKEIVGIILGLLIAFLATREIKSVWQKILFFYMIDYLAYSTFKYLPL